MTIQVALKVQKGAFNLQADFTAPGSGVTAIFGRSGSGKSTLLRAIAGLEESMPGSEVSVNGVNWSGCDLTVPVHRRRVGYVFQEPNLFPHLSVQGNLEYALRRRPLDVEGSASMEEVVTLLGLEILMSRRTTTLSGGEKQ